MISIIINIIAIIFIGFIVYWFWLSKNPAQKIYAQGIVEIKVKDGIYAPALILVQHGKPMTLRFIREDATPCAEVVIFGQLKLSKTLPLHMPTDIIVAPTTPIGEYEFTCQMGMYRGKLVIT